MKTAGWGNFPHIEASYLSFDGDSCFKDELPFITRGNGRSYGDSALYTRIIGYKSKNRFLAFDANAGILHCEAGAMLDDILNVFVPRGWFLTVTPGTKRITVGGAIAADVHGKNHHIAGTFSQCVVDFKLLLPDGTTVVCSERENRDFFHATCGGMGLTGIILEARIRMKKINSAMIDRTLVRTANLKETFGAFDDYADKAYSVAWIDCLTGGAHRGRAILTFGEHAVEGGLEYRDSALFRVPVYFPSFSLNNLSVRFFNTVYYHKAPGRVSVNRVGINSFFYPLDAIDDWNKIYGKPGFTQYQFVLPFETSYEGLEKILTKIAASGKGSFLAVLKLFGPANENWLSFPMRGYTLALDFKIEPSLFPLLDALDKIVLDYGGRFYLAKDARVSKSVFEKGYPMLDDFRRFRSEKGLNKALHSLQSQRLGL